MQYDIYRSTDPNDNGTYIGMISAHPAPDGPDYFCDVTAENLITYYYRVRASNLAGESRFQCCRSWMERFLLGLISYASDGTYEDGIFLSWNAHPAAQFNKVYRSVDPLDWGTEIGISTTGTFEDTTALASIEYTYRVKACSSQNCSPGGGGDTGWRSLRVPTGVTASDGSQYRVTVSWNPVAGAAYYAVYRGSYYDLPDVYAGNSTGTIFEDISIPNRTYFYRVAACSNGFCSYLSDYDPGWRALQVPVLQASDGEFYDRIRLTWEMEAGIHHYEIYRSTVVDQAGGLLEIVTGGIFEDMAALPGQMYYYRIKACTTAGCSSFSTPEAGWRRVGIPVDLTATTNLPNGISLAWAAVPDIPIYQVYRTLLPSGSPRLVGSPSSPAFEDTTAIPGYLYRYQVKACYPPNCGDLSSPAEGQRLQSAYLPLGFYDDNVGLFFEGDWTLSGSLHRSESPGNFAVFFFQGECVSLFYPADPLHGQVDVYIDDVLVSTLSQYLPGATTLVQSGALCAAEGQHTLKLVHASGGMVEIDGISVVERVVYDHHFYLPLFP